MKLEPSRVTPRTSAPRALALVSLAAVLANASWFSATAVVPALEREWRLDSAGAAWLAIVVQIGFVAGSVGAALLNLPDRVESRRLIAAAALTAAVANLGVLAAHGLAVALPTRFLVGVALSGVYAPAVKLVATHYSRGRGVATGFVVGALTLGSGAPHLVRAVGDIPWQVTIIVTSALAVLAALAIATVRPGPGATVSPPVDIGAAARALVRDRPLRLVLFGYLGHMWELYALWAWMAAFFVAARGAAVGASPGRAETGVTVFVAIGVGGLVGSVVAGWMADRLGRAVVAGGAMLVSASCCLASPLVFGAGPTVLVIVLVLWGLSAVADSAQFSAATTELAEPSYAGSILALQLALGFVLTMVSIRLVPAVVGAAGWRFALLPLAPGPIAGAVAMLRLRASPLNGRLG